MRLKKFVCVFLFSALLVSSVNMTAFAKETDEKYDYAKINDRISAVFGSDSEESKAGISVDTIKKAYEDIRNNYLEKIGQSDSDETADTSEEIEESLPQENSGEEFVLQADGTEFTWDKSDFIGIAVNTNSKSKNVSITKNGELVASNDDRGVYITFGRVGMTAKILKTLDVGENKLTLKFDDGTIDININVTDKKHSSDTAEITADKTEFTWDRNSSDSISIKTNSKSDSISVRQSGKIFSTSDKKNISISDGVVTMKPEFLNKLNDGENELKLIFDDGSITVKINVTGSVEDSKNSSVSSKNSDSSSGIGVLPSTGSEGLTVGAVIALLSAGLSGILLSTKKKREK